MALLVRGAAYLLRDADRVEHDADLLVEGKHIAAIGPNLPVPPATPTLDAAGCAVIPGLVNAHTHLYQNLIKGIGAGLELVPWCDAVLFPTVEAIQIQQRAGNERPAYLWSALAAVEMIHAGTTCCQDLDVSMDGVFQAWADTGLRGVGAITLSDTWIPAELIAEKNKAQATVLGYVERWHDPESRITISLGPSTPYLCGEELLIWARDQAEARGLGLHIHVGEIAGEVADSLRDHGQRPVERLERLGLLHERLSAAHCVHVSEAEIELLARRGVTVVHCPKSNMKLADGTMSWPALRAAGIGLALGNDGCASNDLLDLWEEMRAATLLGCVAAHDPKAVSAAEVLRAATEGGARACRVDAGTLDPGRLADVVVVDLGGPHLRPVHDILGTLVYCARAADVRDTIVDGRVVMRARRIVTVDETSLVAEAEETGRALRAQALRSNVRRAGRG